MTIQCPECSNRYRIDPSQVSKPVAKARCPQCSAVFEVQLRSVPPAGVLPSDGAGTADFPGAEILVVDDSKLFRELVADVLKPLNLNLLTAADGAEALRTIQQERPALVILDLNLPGMNGYELIRRVRTDPALDGLRLLVMSGVYHKEADAVEVQAAGADDFLSKSFKPEQLQFRVKKLLADSA